MRENCKLHKNGRCIKYGGKVPCKPSDRHWFGNDEYNQMQVCEVDEVCERSSIFGNYFFKITREQLEQLLAGKVLYDCDEYGMFIVLEEAK